jgi:hypothetical protein
MVAAKIASLPKGANQHAPIGATSQDGAAEMLNVSPRSVTRAKAVQESGDASLIADVESGEVTVSAAAKIATMQSGARTDLRSIDLRSQTQAALERKPAGNGRCENL